MAKIGYIMAAAHYDKLEEDRQWMQEYGCVKIVEENDADEKSRPLWKQLMIALERGDELVISKFSNALRGARELSFFLELCRIKVVRIISIHDKVDSKDEVFPPLSSESFLNIFGSLPSEVAIQRKASSHILKLHHVKVKTKSTKSRQEREATIVNMYNGGHAIDDIWRQSGFRSRSSIFRILNKYGITLNRGPHSGPIRKRNANNDSPSKEE